MARLMPWQMRPIPGSSIGANKYGSHPHSRPPQFTNPDEALNYVWTTLHKKDNLQKLWLLLEKGATAYKIAKTMIYKMSLDGIIQRNLGIVIGQTVQRMIYVLGKSKGIDVQLNPKFQDPVKDVMDAETMSKLNGHKNTVVYPKSALDTMKLPKPAEAKALYDKKQKLKELHGRMKNISAMINTPSETQIEPKPVGGLLNMAQGQG